MSDELIPTDVYNAAILDYAKSRGMEKAPDETDAAFLLRATARIEADERRHSRPELAPVWRPCGVCTAKVEVPAVVDSCDLLVPVCGPCKRGLPSVAPVARPLDEWHEGMAPALWWRFPIVEPPYSGTPLDDDFPDYVTHWTPIVCPEEVR